MFCHKWIEHLLLYWRVFYCAKGSLWWFLADIFYACESERVVFQDLHVRIPFDDFKMGVLRILNEALTQLHPNGWTTMRAFRALFLYSSVPTMPRLYYYFFALFLQSSTRQGSMDIVDSNIEMSSLLPFHFSLQKF